jgi:hypothetical protein
MIIIIYILKKFVEYLEQVNLYMIKKLVNFKLKIKIKKEFNQMNVNKLIPTTDAIALK